MGARDLPKGCHWCHQLGRRSRTRRTEVPTKRLDAGKGGVSVGESHHDSRIARWDPEPDRPKGVTKPSRGQRPRNGVSIVASALKGRDQSADRLVCPFRAEWDFGVGFPRALPWAGFGEGLWPADTDHTPTGVVHGHWNPKSNRPAEVIQRACEILLTIRAPNQSSGRLAPESIQLQTPTFQSIHYRVTWCRESGGTPSIRQSRQTRSSPSRCPAPESLPESTRCR